MYLLQKQYVKLYRHPNTHTVQISNYIIGMGINTQLGAFNIYKRYP
jgi:hypothetical protein